MSLFHRPPAWRLIEGAATLSYPILVHGAVVAERPDWALAALILVAGIYLLGAVWRSSSGGIATAASLMGLAVVGLFLGERQALFLPPIGMTLLLFLLFARTLLPGREPLVTRIARALGDEGADIARYTRMVTLVWSAFFLVLTLETLLLALYAPLAIWSLFTNAINYLLVALLMVGEWLVRRQRFRHRTTAGWRQFGRADWGALLRG